MHLPSILPDSLLEPVSSNQVTLRHPETTIYRCFFSDLTGFIEFCRVGPGLQHHLTPVVLPDKDLKLEFNPAIADCRFRAPLAPHLARPHKNRKTAGATLSRTPEKKDMGACVLPCLHGTHDGKHGYQDNGIEDDYPENGCHHTFPKQFEKRPDGDTFQLLFPIHGAPPDLFAIGLVTSLPAVV